LLEGRRLELRDTRKALIHNTARKKEKAEDLPGAKVWIDLRPLTDKERSLFQHAFTCRASP
jgi:hypothetical protein